MIAEGGDTDTNAAIVGGLIGAWQGLSAVTPDQTMTLFKARCDDLREWKGKQRPSFLVPGLYLP